MPKDISVVTNTATEFDAGPLSWVRGEIEQALARGLELLATFAAAPAERGPLRHARNHVHQAAGAIQMVGLDAVVVYTDEIERQLAQLEELPEADVVPACRVIDRACLKLVIFLDELVSGAPPVALKLFPEYDAMQRARGVKAAAPTDLFFPDLGVRAPVPEAPLPVSKSKRASHLVKQRRLYEGGLLAFLRGDSGAARTMRDAIAGIEHASTTQSARTFWWTVGAFFDAIIGHGLKPRFGVKQLAARIDLQIRRVVEGSAKVSDRLRREVLYYVAASKPVTPSVRAVQEAYALAGLIPSDEVLNADVVRLQPILREARELLASAKDLWMKASSGRADSMPKLKQALTTVSEIAVDVGNASLTKLTASLVARLDKMPPSGNASESLAMEYATGMLLAETAVENFGSLSSEFPKQVEAMLARLDAAQASRPIPAATAPLLDEMSRRAQERVLLTHVAREIQVNLRRIEQVLDAFFRDHGRRNDLATLAKESRQIRGALRILGQDDAERLLGLCQDQIDSYADPEAPVDGEGLELLAESLSGLGFFIEALEQQRPDRQRLIAPLLAKRLGETPAADADARPDTVEDAVEEMRVALPQLVAEFHRAPADPGAREMLKTRLRDLVDDAKLIDDGELVAQAEAALDGLEGGGTVALAAAVNAIAESGATVQAPVPAISEETQRLLATDARGLDAELLDIYLAEAAEVLDVVAANHALLVGNPGDRDALRTVRRQFHTLKGSGRMVGLTELGEIAYDVEKIHNRLLEDDRAATPAVLAMIEIAERDFRGWIATLKDTGTVAGDPAELHAAIDRVAAELPPDHEMPVAPSAPPAAAPAPDVLVLPELGGAPAETTAEAAQWADETEADGEDGAELIEVAPVGEVLVPGEVHDEIATPADITIGDVTLPFDLYHVLIDEAQTHLATLELGLAFLQSDPDRRPSAEMVRASHTLCGIHRTGGLPLIASTAKALEECLLACQQLVEPVPDQALRTLGGAVRVLGGLLGRVKARIGFNATDTADAEVIQRELEALRRDAIAASDLPEVGDAETLAERESIGDEIQMMADDVTVPEPTVSLLATPELPEIELALPEAAAAASMEAAESEESPALAKAAEAIVRAQAGEPPALAAAAASQAQESIVPAQRTPEVPEQVAHDPSAASVDAPAPAAPPPSEAGPDIRVPAAPLAMAPPSPPAHAKATEPPRTEAPRDPLAEIRDDVDEQVLPIFLEEASELYPQAGEQVRAWRRAPADSSSARQLRRTLHTLKGSARMAGAMRLGELAHLMESRLVVDDVAVTGTPELFEALDADLDRIATVLDALREGKTNVALTWTVGADEAPAPTPAAAPDVVPAAAPPVRPVVVPLGMPEIPARATRDAADVDAGARAMLRVRADIIDRLVNEAGEVSIARARIEVELRALKANLLELTGSVIRLRTQVREIEIQAESQIQSRLMQVGEGEEGFDPLEFDRYTRFQELARSLAEGVNDVSTVQQSLLKNLDVADAALIAQARLSRDVQQQLFAIRTVPFGSVSERLYRILRGTAKELDKRANLEIRGAQTELDRAVLEKLVGPLEHLLRNALGHGIESRSVRAKAGKSETGEITLTVRQVGNEIAIELADDGGGLDLDRIRAKAAAQRRFAADAPPTDDQLVKYIFEPGFSTAAKVTQVSGRGIGMDVVRAEIAALGGRVEVSTQAGRGTTFMLYLPLTLAVAQAVLVRAGGRLWALPAPMVEQIQHVKPEALVNLYVRRSVEWQGLEYPFHYLPRLLGDSNQIPESARQNPVLLLRSGQGLAAVHVDELIGNQEVVVKNIGPQLARVSGIAGATVLGTGEIVLIINPVQLAQRSEMPLYDPNAERLAPEMPKPTVAHAGRPLVMIVDDSLTVRRIASRLLIREGFDVLTAKDGVDALELLRTEVPDVILLDIEMPRMDGFEFTKMIKADPQHASIPIVMITSRTAEKHRNRAIELGVDLFLGKPFQEEELLRHLREMLALTP